mmetsp:Transcript_7851/g.21827  ORF Transcript_7851/g.21827 Transcript_7851/m.21827 type:complete len:193 (-) Transcript_7851:116-694(-)
MLLLLRLMLYSMLGQRVWQLMAPEWSELCRRDAACGPFDCTGDVRSRVCGTRSESDMHVPVFPDVTDSMVLSTQAYGPCATDPPYAIMVAERWIQLQACQPLDQRSRRRQQCEQACDDERGQQIETLGRMRARSGRSRRDEVMRKYVENRRSLARQCSIEREELMQHSCQETLLDDEFAVGPLRSSRGGCTQ